MNPTEPQPEQPLSEELRQQLADLLRTGRTVAPYDDEDCFEKNQGRVLPDLEDGPLF